MNRRGQRAVIYGHSMGTKVAAYFFTWLGSQMSETQRLRWIDEYVGMYVSNGGPLLGSPDIVPTCVEILPRVRAEPPRRPPRHRAGVTRRTG